MTRRGILGALLGAATMDPERLLWVPGKRVISIPKPIANSYGVPEVYWVSLDEYVRSRRRLEIMRYRGTHVIVKIPELIQL
jgi:hypothetical protein